VPQEVKQLAEHAQRRLGAGCIASGSLEHGKLTLTWQSREELANLRELFA
jgi:hypothetical protein